MLLISGPILLMTLYLNILQQQLYLTPTQANISSSVNDHEGLAFALLGLWVHRKVRQCVHKPALQTKVGIIQSCLSSFFALAEARLTLQKTRDTMQHFRTSSLDCAVSCHCWQQEQRQCQHNNIAPPKHILGIISILRTRRRSVSRGEPPFRIQFEIRQ